MITLERVRQEREEFRWIRPLFRATFPLSERPPFFLLRRFARRNVDWRKIVADGENAGFFYTLLGEKTAYVFFFAIRPELRGRGIGTEALKALLETYAGQTVFLAIEPVEEGAPNLEERIRRKEFYRRCGLVPTGQRVWEGAMIYEVLGTGPAPEEEYGRMLRRWLGPVFTHLVPTGIRNTK